MNENIRSAEVGNVPDALLESARQRFAQHGKRFKKSTSRFTEVDPGLGKFIHKRLKEKLSSNEYAERFGPVTDFQPGSKTVLPMALGYTQGGYIVDTLFPAFIGGVDLKADYPSGGLEMYDQLNTLVGFQGNPKRLDIKITWNTVRIDLHANETVVDDLEAKAASTLPFSFDTELAVVQEAQIRNEKESAFQTILGTAGTGSYTSGFYTTLSGNAQWSYHTQADYTGHPIDEVRQKQSKLRKAVGAQQFNFWCGPDVIAALITHPDVKSAIQYAGLGAKSAPGGIASLDTLTGLLGCNIVVGGAGALSSGARTDLWLQDAGLLAAPTDSILTQRFMMNLTTEAFPYFYTYREERPGVRGANVQKFSHAWKTIQLNKSAGYLWKNATAAF
jgi:hypothetical protein